jgi:hypothetical protein
MVIFSPRPLNPDNVWIQDWVGPRAGMSALKRKGLFPAGSRTAIRCLCSLWPSYWSVCAVPTRGCWIARNVWGGGEWCLHTSRCSRVNVEANEFRPFSPRMFKPGTLRMRSEAISCLDSHFCSTSVFARRARKMWPRLSAPRRHHVPCDFSRRRSAMLPDAVCGLRQLPPPPPAPFVFLG